MYNCNDTQKRNVSFYNASHRPIQVWRYLNKNTIYFFKKHYVQLKRKQVLQSTGYAGCRKHLHRTWNQLRKISEPLALKALDFRPVTAQPQEMQCCRSATSLMWRPQRVAFRNLSAALSKSRIPDHLPKEPRYSLEQVPEASRAHLVS